MFKGKAICVLASVVAAGSISAQVWDGWDGPPVDWGVMPVHFVMFKTGNALVWPPGANLGTRASLVKRIGYSDWSKTDHWLDQFSGGGGHFCGGHTLMDDADGTLLIAGGDDGVYRLPPLPPHGIKVTSLFREVGSSGEWLADVAGAQMNKGSLVSNLPLDARR